MDNDRLILYIVTDLIFCLTPGPATMVTVGHALGGGLRAAVGPVAGIHVGNWIWFALSGLGLIALVTAYPDAYAALRWAGVAYLLWTGARMWLRAGGWRQARERRGGFWNGFGDGLAVHMSNPKALIFYAAFVPQFIDPSGSIASQVLILAGVTLVTESIGMGTYALLAAGAKRFAVGRDWNRLLGRVSGSVMILVALVMAWLNGHGLTGP